VLLLLQTVELYLLLLINNGNKLLLNIIIF